MQGVLHKDNSELKFILFLTVHLFQVILEAELTELKERERSLQKELEVLQEASRGQERDILTLNSVLQSNQDVINVRQIQGQTHTQSQGWLLTDHLNIMFRRSFCPLLVLAFTSRTV